MTRRRISSLLAIAAALAVLPAAPRAMAEPTTTERALATALFNEGRALMAEKRWAEACPKLAESQRLDPGGGTLLNLAICHEESGETATAWAELNDALAMALRENRDDREDIARAHIAALEPRLARLQVRVRPESAPADLEVTLDGAPLRRASWGTAVPVNPGAHALVARATGRVPWTGSAEAAPGTVVAVDVPVLTLAPPPPAVVHPPSAERPVQDPSTRRTIGWVVGGVGVATLLVGAAAGVVAIAEASAARDGCKPETCPDQKTLDESTAHTDTADTAAIVANIMIPVGVAVTALGAVLVLTSPSPKPRPALRAFVSAGAGRIELRGVF